MVRTRADAGATKVAGAKAPRKVLTPSAGSSAMVNSPIGKGARYSGGNSYNPQPTPSWQKGINTFFKEIPKPQVGEEAAASNEEAEEMETHDSPAEEERSTPSPVNDQSSPVKASQSEQFEKNGMISDDDD